MLALALQIHEDRTDPVTGQDVALSTDPRLAEYWTTMQPVRDYAQTALIEAQKRNEDREHPEALRYVVGLREGWEAALAVPDDAPQQADAANEGD